MTCQAIVALTGGVTPLGFGLCSENALDLDQWALLGDPGS